MSFLKNLKNKESEVQQHQSSLLDKIKVTSDVQSERMEICRGCEHLSKHLNRCNQCGCFMDLKTWMPDQHCPLYKWDKV